MRAAFVHRLLLTLLPAMLIASVALSTVWGRNGLVERAELRHQLERQTTDLATIDRQNQQLLRQLSLMDRDPIVLERLVAEELGWGRPDAVIYDFGPPTP